jgi:hypothetical protein
MMSQRTLRQRCRHSLRGAALLTASLAIGLPAWADVPPLKKRIPANAPTAKSEGASVLKAPKLMPAVGQVSDLSGLEETAGPKPAPREAGPKPAPRDGTRSVPATLTAPIGEHGILRRNAVRPTAATSTAPPLMHLPPIQGHRRLDWADDAVPDDKPLHSLTTNVLPNKGELPANYAAARFAKAGEEWHHVGTSRPWVEMFYDWEATSFCHGPLYFEEDYIERYGHSWGPAQPFVSGAHFFARIPLIPYMATVYPPHECIYTLGHERPGNYVPYHYVRLPLRASAAAVQAGVVTGLVYLIP